MRISILLLMLSFLYLNISIAKDVEPDNYCAENQIDIKQATAFVRNLQLVIKNNDIDKISSMVAYPLRVNVTYKNQHYIKSTIEFKKNYKKIFTQAIRARIEMAEAQDIFCNYQGAMIASGVVWFAPMPNQFKVFTINQ